MATTVFDAAAASLQAHSELDKLEARGTLRLALKAAGLDTETLDLMQLNVVFHKVMPDELSNRGVSEAESVCEAVITDLKGMTFAETATSPEELFRKLGND